MMKMFEVLVTRLVLATVMIFAAVDKGGATEGDNWQFTIEPYLMATSIEGDTSIGRATLTIFWRIWKQPL